MLDQKELFTNHAHVKNENKGGNSGRGSHFSNKENDFCYKCHNKVYVFRIIKKRKWCYPCAEKLITWIKMQNGTLKENTKLCSCCKTFGKIVYVDGYGRLDLFYFCEDCIKEYCSSLIMLEVQQ